MSTFDESQLERDELAELGVDIDMVHTPEDVFSVEAMENIFDAEPMKRAQAKWEVRATGTIEGAKWSLSRALSDVMDSGLWRFSERQGTPELGKLEPMADRRQMAFREVRPVIFYPEEITADVVRMVRIKFSEVFFEGMSLLLNVRMVDELDIHQGCFIEWDDKILYSVRVPFREEGHKFKPEAGWTFWWAHPYTCQPSALVEFHMVLVEVPETGRKLRLIGLPEDIDALFSKHRGLILHNQVNVWDGERKMWRWIPASTMEEDAETRDPIRVITAKGKTTEIKPRFVTRTSAFIRMPVNLPNLVGDAQLRWVAKAQEIMKELAGGLKTVHHGEGVITEVVVPGSYRTPEEILASGAIERITDSGIDLHEHAHYKLNEWYPCGDAWVNRLDKFPVHMVRKDNFGELRWDWEYWKYTNAERHTMQDFYPLPIEQEFPKPDELDLSSEVWMQDILVRNEDQGDVDILDVASIAFSMPNECPRNGCKHRFDTGVERKCPKCGQQAGFGILYSSERGAHCPIRWDDIRQNRGKLIVKEHEHFGFSRRWIGGTNFGEFLSAVKRIIRDRECELSAVAPDMFTRDLKAWRKYVDEHGNDVLYPGAMIKRGMLRTLGEKSVKRIYIPTTFVDPDKFLRILYSVPDGRFIHGRPNAVFKVLPQLKDGRLSKFPLRYPDYKGTEPVVVKAWIDMHEHARGLGLKRVALPSPMMVVVLMNDFVRAIRRERSVVVAEKTLARLPEIEARELGKEVK